MDDTLFYVATVALLAFALFMVLRAVRKGERERERRAAELEARKRKEKELLGRLERLKEPDLERAKRVINEDPKRAARVIGRMMRDK